jgi:hypothetical protein
VDHEITIATDTATVAVFDPAVLQHRLAVEADWWCRSFRELPEVRDGRIVLFSTGADGIYAARITDGDLTQDERAYAREQFRFGMVVESDRLFVGPAEYLVGEGFSPTDSAEFDRFFVEWNPGTYSVDLFTIDWAESPRWYVPTGMKVPADAPADLVLIVRPALRPVTVTSEPRVSGAQDSWLFTDELRVVGPVIGMTLVTTVIKTTSGLALKHAGPGGYRPVLSELAGLQWHDKIVVCVDQVDHAKREMQVLFVRRSL